MKARRKFVIYEVWTRAVITEADTMDEALEAHEMSNDISELTLSNWHAVAVEEEKQTTETATEKAVDSLRSLLEQHRKEMN